MKQTNYGFLFCLCVITLMSFRSAPTRVLGQGPTIRITYEAIDGTDSAAIDINPANIRTIIPLNSYIKSKADTNLGRIRTMSGVVGITSGDTLRIWADTTPVSALMPRTTANKTVGRLDSTDASIISLIPAGQVNSDWTSSSGISQILHKPIISTVGNTGLYSDLISSPTDLSSFTNGPNYLVPASIAGKADTVSLNTVKALIPSSTTGLPEGTNKYYTDTRARVAVNLTTTGTTGVATYNNTTGTLNIPTPAAGGSVSSVGLSSTDLSVSGSPITSTGNITANLNTTGVTAGTYNGSYTVDSKGRLTVAMTVSVNPTPGRSLSTTGTNNTFTISSTRNARVTYTINYSVNLGGLLASSANTTLAYSLNSGTTWVSVQEAPQSYALGVIVNTSQAYTLTGEIPAGALVRIYTPTASNVNTTVTLSSVQQEILQ